MEHGTNISKYASRRCLPPSSGGAAKKKVQRGWIVRSRVAREASIIGDHLLMTKAPPGPPFGRRGKGQNSSRRQKGPCAAGGGGLCLKRHKSLSGDEQFNTRKAMLIVVGKVKNKSRVGSLSTTKTHKNNHQQQRNNNNPKRGDDVKTSWYSTHFFVCTTPHKEKILESAQRKIFT